MPKILFVTNDAWFFVSHRLPIAEAVVMAIGEAVVAARADESVARILAAKVGFRSWQVSPRGRSPLGELGAFLGLARIIRRERPDIVHLITIKPVLYGGLLARFLSVPGCVFAIAGLGAVFVAESRKGRAARALLVPLYRFAVEHPNGVLVFQNRDDRDALLTRLDRPALRTRLIRGSGVDTAAFTVVPEPSGVPHVTLAARRLRDKGIVEFVEAARLLGERGVAARFRIAGGDAGRGNPAAFGDGELERLAAAASVELLGHRTDIAALYAESALVVLPSYREGLPRALVEAGAAGRAVVTTDVPGCRDAIEPGVSGLTVPPRDAHALAAAIGELLADPARRRAMGLAGRHLVEREMRVERVVESHLEIYRELLGAAG